MIFKHPTKLSDNYLFWLVFFSLLFPLLIIAADFANKNIKKMLITDSPLYRLNWQIFVQNTKLKHYYNLDFLTKIIGNKPLSNQPNKISCGVNCQAFFSHFPWNPSTSRDQTARWLYELGLAHYRDNDLNEAKMLIDLARQHSPQWSYFHLELANLYVVQGEFSQANQILDDCLKYRFAAASCQRYRHHLPQSQFQVGFYQNIAKQDMIHY